MEHTDITEDKTVSTRFQIPTELHRFLKVLAASIGIPLHMLINDILQAEMDRRNPGDANV